MNNPDASWVLSGLEEPTLNSLEKELRDKFVHEFLVDYDYTAAAVRVGYQGPYAAEYGMRFRTDAYVQRKITEAMGASPEDGSDAHIVELQRRRVMNSLMREANYRGPGSSHGARVSALSKLAAIHGMDAPVKTEAKVTHDGLQELKITHDFDFEKLGQEELLMVRKLLMAQVPNDNQRA